MDILLAIIIVQVISRRRRSTTNRRCRRIELAYTCWFFLPFAHYSRLDHDILACSRLSLFLLHSHQVETKNSEEVDGMLRIKKCSIVSFPSVVRFFSSSFVVFGDSTRFLSLGIPRGASVSPLYMCLFIHPSHPIQLHPISFPPYFIPIFRHYIYFSIWRCAIRRGWYVVRTFAAVRARVHRTVLGLSISSTWPVCRFLFFFFFLHHICEGLRKIKPPKSIVPSSCAPRVFPHLAVHVHIPPLLVHILFTGM